MELVMCYEGNTFFTLGTGTTEEQASLEKEGAANLAAYAKKVKKGEDKVNVGAYMVALAAANSQAAPEPASEPTASKPAVDPVAIAMGA